jgi:aspartate aminotransferase
MRSYCEAGMAIVCEALERFPRVRLCSRPRAGMYVFFEIDGMPDSRQACADLLAASGVGLAPGVFFGPGSESFLRACVCRAPQSLHTAMDRLAPALV